MGSPYYNGYHCTAVSCNLKSCVETLGAAEKVVPPIVYERMYRALEGVYANNTPLNDDLFDIRAEVLMTIEHFKGR